MVELVTKTASAAFVRREALPNANTFQSWRPAVGDGVVAGSADVRVRPVCALARDIGYHGGGMHCRLPKASSPVRFGDHEYRRVGSGHRPSSCLMFAIATPTSVQLGGQSAWSQGACRRLTVARTRPGYIEQHAWMAAGPSLGEMARVSNSWVGDRLRDWTMRCGESCAEAARVAGIDTKIMRSILEAAWRFDLSRRRDKLTGATTRSSLFSIVRIGIVGLIEPSRIRWGSLSDVRGCVAYFCHPRTACLC